MGIIQPYVERNWPGEIHCTISMSLWWFHLVVRTCPPVDVRYWGPWNRSYSFYCTTGTYESDQLEFQYRYIDCGGISCLPLIIIILGCSKNFSHVQNSQGRSHFDKKVVSYTLLNVFHYRYWTRRTWIFFQFTVHTTTGSCLQITFIPSLLPFLIQFILINISF